MLTGEIVSSKISMCCSARRNRFKLSAKALEQKLTQFYQAFEDSALRLTAVIGMDGVVKACIRRSDVTVEDTERTLTKISEVKRQASLLSALLGSGTPVPTSPFHIIGKTEAVSLFYLGDKDLLVLVSDLNPNMPNFRTLRDIEPMVLEKVAELYEAMYPHKAR